MLCSTTRQLIDLIMITKTWSRIRTPWIDNQIRSGYVHVQYILFILFICLNTVLYILVVHHMCSSEPNSNDRNILINITYNESFAQIYSCVYPKFMRHHNRTNKYVELCCRRRTDKFWQIVPRIVDVYSLRGEHKKKQPLYKLSLYLSLTYTHAREHY